MMMNPPPSTSASGVGFSCTAMFEGCSASMPRRHASGGASLRALGPLSNPGTETTTEVDESLSASLVGSARTCCRKAARAWRQMRRSGHRTGWA